MPSEPGHLTSFQGYSPNGRFERPVQQRHGLGEERWGLDYIPAGGHRYSLSSIRKAHYVVLTLFRYGGVCVDPAIRRRLVDFRVLPLLAVVYAIALIDRINLGVARTAGMGADLVRCYSNPRLPHR